jgi:hypothetical protein
LHRSDRRIPFDPRARSDYSDGAGYAIPREDPVKVKVQNLRVAPVALLLRSRPLERSAGHRRADLSVTGMVCPL